jgi:hypothetical protein
LTGSDASVARVNLDRLNVKLSLGPVDLTVGRQPINFSKAWFWNPLDVFLPFDPKTFDRDYKPGVDAVKLDWMLGELAGLNLVAAPGPTLRLNASGQVLAPSKFWEASWYGSALLARAFTTVLGADLALQGGKVYGGYQVGMGFATSVGDFGLRGEGAYLFTPTSSTALLPGADGVPREVSLVEPHGSAVIGVDRRFENTLSLALEYGFNGAGVDGGDYLAAFARQSVGALNSVSPHLLGANASYELLPVLVGRLATVVSLTDRSVLAMPSVTWSVSDEAELMVGAVLGFGRRTDWTSPVPEPQSEFGAQPLLFYAELKVYF